MQQDGEYQGHVDWKLSCNNKCTARGETFQKTVKHVEIHINKKMWPCFKTAHRHSHED